MQIVRNYLICKDEKNDKKHTELDVEFKNGGIENYIKSNMIKFDFSKNFIDEKIKLLKEVLRENLKEKHYINLKENEGFAINKEGIEFWIRLFSDNRFIFSITIWIDDERVNSFSIECCSGRDEIERVINELIEE